VLWPSPNLRPDGERYDTPKKSRNQSVFLHGFCGELKGVRDVANADLLAINQHADDIETVRLPWPAMAVDPGTGRPGKLALLAPVDRFDGIAEVGGVARFNLDERDQTAAFDDEVDVPVA
jgi:hypothetical protein